MPRRLKLRHYFPITIVHLGYETSALRWEGNESVLLHSHRTKLTLLIGLIDPVLERDIDVRFANARMATIETSSGFVLTSIVGESETCNDAWKLKPERTLSTASGALGFSLIILRLPNIYDRPQTRPAIGRGFMTQQIEMALRGEPLHYFRGTPFIRDYLHIDDVVGAFISAAEESKSLNQHYVVGTGVGTSMAQVLG